MECSQCHLMCQCEVFWCEQPDTVATSALYSDEFVTRLWSVHANEGVPMLKSSFLSLLFFYYALPLGQLYDAFDIKNKLQ